MTAVAITSITDPVTGTVDVAGTTDDPANVVAVVVADATGNSASGTAVVTGTSWLLEALDVSALSDGVLVASVTASHLGALAFAAKATQKRSALHVTYEPWATHADVLAPSTIDPAVLDDACWIASDVLFLLTGSRWPGRGTDKVRPQARYRQYDRPMWWQNLASVPGSARTFSRYGWCSCNRGQDYGCVSIPEIQLPHYPIDESSIVVKINGTQFDDWMLLDKSWLVRTDGQGWLCCQRMTLPDTEVGTWSVEFAFGSHPDSGGVRAAAALGYQLALAYTNDEKCRLPKRISHLTRGSTSVTLLDPMTLAKNGLIGMTEVDLWIASKMIGDARRPATIRTVGRSARFRREG